MTDEAPQQLAEMRRPLGVFVSYRRQDSQGSVGRLTDGLVLALGRQVVFRDVNAIEPGMNFEAEIDNALRSCTVVLAVIGPRWLERLQAFDTSTGHGSTDYVRYELRAALARRVQIIPVVVDGATMPRPDALPDDLKSLALLQSHELSDTRWEYDLGQLLLHLKRRAGWTSDAPQSKTAVGVQYVTLIALAGLATAAAYPEVTSTLVFASDAVLASSIRPPDGGAAALFLGGLALLLRFLQKNLEEALTARVGNWLKSGRVLGLSALLGIFVWLLLASERPYCAGSIVLVATGYFLIQRFRPQLVSSVGRSLVASVIATAAVGAALALDVNFAYSQQADLDVVVVLTPREELSNAGNVKTVFANLRRALAEPLKDVKNIAIARGTTPLERGLSVRTPIHRVSPLAGSRC